MAKVLNATAVELGRIGYAALRIEDVAERCGVNKTTIYRRWPTKIELVQALLSSFSISPESIPDTGALRTDLLAHFTPLLAKLRSSAGRGLIRTLQSERTHPELEPMVRKLRTDQRAVRRMLFERAIARGELPKGVDLELLVELVGSPVIGRIAHHVEVDEAFVQAAIDVVIAGAAATVPTRSRPKAR